MDRLDHVTESVDPNVVVLVSMAILRRGMILLVREEAQPYNKSWVLPQGYPKSNETLADAGRREVREELGMDVEVLNFVGVYEDFRQDDERVLHYIIACFLGGIRSSDEIRPSYEVIDSAWIDPSKGWEGAPLFVQRMLRDVSSTIKKKRFGFSRRGFGV